MSADIIDAEVSCRALLAAYAVAVDEGDGAALAGLFTPDGVLKRGDTELRGAAELPRIVADRPDDLVMRHHLTTVSIRVASDGREASGRAYYLLYRGRGSSLPLDLGPPFSAGDWVSRFVRTDSGWRLASHEVRRLFVTRPDGGASPR